MDEDIVPHPQVNLVEEVEYWPDDELKDPVSNGDPNVHDEILE